jgi:hypothetical protein
MARRHKTALRVRAEHGNHVSSDLVCSVAVGSDAIGADYNCIDFPALHHVTGHVVSDHCDRNVVLRQFPRG